METFLTNQILHAISAADYPKILGYGLIFLLLWIELRGLRTEMHKLRENVSQSFSAGETRFKNLENQNLYFQGEITLLKSIIAELKVSSDKTKDV